jgi:hypothetical protein
MKTTHILTLFSFILLISCGSSKYFEGTVKYRFESNLYNEGNDINLDYNEYTKREFGEYHVESHKEGNYFRDFEGKDSIGLDFQLYLKKTNIKYTKYNYNDTLYWESPSNLNGANNFKVLEKKKKDTLIINEELNFMSTQYYLPYEGNVLRMNEKYYYNDNLKINPNDYIKYKEYFVYETFKEIKSLPFLYIKKSTSSSFPETLIEKIHLIEKNEMKIDLKSILSKIKGKPLKEK